MSDTKTVIFDVDGVLADFVQGFTKRCHELFPEVPVTTTHDQPGWNGFPGMSAEQLGATWNSVKNDRNFWQNLSPLVTWDVFDRIDFLSDDHRVYFVTSRVGIDCKAQTEMWLSWQGISRPTVIISKAKGDFAKAVSADYAIEDKANNASCIDWITGGDTKSFLINRPYNQCHPDFMASGVIRINSVAEYLDVIEGKAELKEAA